MVIETAIKWFLTLNKDKSGVLPEDKAAVNDQHFAGYVISH
jgi:hypothetical protein